MISLGQTVTVLILGFAVSCEGLKATIIADTNRDGKVDITSNTDLVGKEIWTESSGALILANIGDSGRRCSSKINSTVSDRDLDLCNDASDDILRNPHYLAPVRTVPVSVSDAAVGSVIIADKSVAPRVRIFHNTGGNWNYVTSNHTFTAEHLKAGLMLGVDARQVRLPGVWDGKATLEFTVQDGKDQARDRVAIRVAPVLTHHHRQLAEQILASEALPNDTVQKQFLQDLGHAASNAGIRKPVLTINTTTDPTYQFDTWAQDFFEPGYSSIPGPDGPIILRIMIRSMQGRPAGRSVFSELRSNTTGAVQMYQNVNGRKTTDSTGNLETIPPYTHNGKSWPAGRTIMGSQDGVRPLMVSFLTAQEVQAPVEIDTSWLFVGHTDEFLQFLPSHNTKRGWVMMVSDPMAGLSLLERAQQAGHGKTRALSRTKLPSDPPNSCLSSESIDDVLARANFTQTQKYCSNYIQKNIDILKRETGVTEDEIIRVPTMYSAARGLDCPGGDEGQLKAPAPTTKRMGILAAAGDGAELQRRQSEVPQVGALYPACINGVVLSNSEYLAPKPWGPIIDGKDILAEAVIAAYKRAHYNVNFMDDWFSHHTGGGEIHCGSNTIRDASHKWW
ncbi:hypothetical protein QQS21_000695 [Conoideocrella luteorostrata]|uniref:Protein-arginine deiminase C-terminal domain-containing protein n=1 Tax=Conoideocrella luteorostrata TaxID=1105319 RepID=A0AAJ0CYK3_9HYPO|nr:hypothetical protein QQS21_000695 [Conoideocrella luteorostrata]